MRTYRCTCNNRLFFDNTNCLACNKDVGWCEGCGRITTLEPVDESGNYRCSYTDCGQSLRKCHNFAVENVCNRCYTCDPNGPPQSAANNGEPAPANLLCAACQLTETIPDLTVEGNREKWARLETAKRRLLYTLDLVSLPYASVESKLLFDFKADVEHPGDEWRSAGPAEVVYTGHAAGKITINIREADDAVRESLRVQFHEAQRTLIGHFHHEIGHYYWDLLVQNQNEPAFVQLFGDHNAPPYAEAMAAYYQNGPRPDWAQSFISTYASAHPWEDFAETFALYLDIISVLDTATNLFRLPPADMQSATVQPLVERFQEVGILVNEFNRTAGLIDLVPEVIIQPVANKLEFIHRLVNQASAMNKPAEIAAPA